ncbi:unnamed protein product [Paramecium pentaurelia]|uniref:Response regulatory domain-containing protein n=1 Tax=Paramecium pentaurelia TaxID=43138 RepID=A0A8S1VS03_9CILI|nr:unnamed protein product [Paramecium pentaurelia]
MSQKNAGQYLLKELLIFLALLLGLYQSQGVDSILPITLNSIILLIYLFFKYKNSTHIKQVWIIKIIFILIQISINIEMCQFCMIIVHLIEDDIIQTFILSTVFLINLIQEQKNNYVTEIPFNLLYFINVVFLFGLMFMKWKSVKSNEEFVDQTFKLKSLELKESIKNRDLISKSNQQQSVSQEINAIKMECNDDELILQNVAWIQNQSALVYNKKLNIVYQNIFLGKLLKQSNLDEQQTQQQSKPDYEELFLDCQILVGSKELMEINSNNNDQSMNSDGSFLLSRVNDYHKCRMKSNLTIRDLSLMMQNEIDKWRPSMVTLFRLRSDVFDFENIQIKAFVNKVNESSFLIFLFEQQPPQKKKDDNSQPIINIFSTFVHESVSYINCILTLILLTQHEHENTLKISLKHHYYMPMRMMSMRYILFVNSMRDYIFFIQNQLFLRISAFKVNDLIEELLIIYEDNLKIRDVSLTTSIDLSDNNQVIFSDLDRLKQILACLLSYCLKYTSASQLKLDIKSYTVSGIMVSFKDSMIAKDDNTRKSISNLVRLLNSTLKLTSFYDVDLNNPLELQICVILCWQLSGTFKRGLEFLYDSQGYGTFTFVIESQTNQQRMQSHQDTGPIKILGQRKYYETSLSLLLAQDSSGYREESKYFSLTQLSKQFSIKPGDPFDVQSAYFSQISRIKQDSSNSKQVQNSGSVPRQSKEQSNSFSGTWKQGFPDIIQQPYKKTRNDRNEKSDSQHDSMKTHSNFDFGAEMSNPSIHPPELTPKLLSSVIKFRLRLTCCAKVLIVDNDHYSVFSLQKVLEKYNIKCDKAFNGIDAQKLIQNKQNKPCHCGNKSYLLYFIEFYLPILQGIDLVRSLKEQMRNSLIDKGYVIIIATFVDLNQKLECFKNGADYFIAKPFDLIDIGAAVQYLDF